MSTFHLAAPAILPLAAVLVLAVGGCASPRNDPLGLQQDNVIGRLASECYWQHEGARMVYGGLQVYTACRSWARQQVQVTFADAD